MNVIITHEYRFKIDDNGNIYTDNAHSCGYNYFRRYLDVFDNVILVARAKNENCSRLSLVTGKGISFIKIPYFIGPTQYLLMLPKIKMVVKSIFFNNRNSALIARTPGTIGSLLVREFLKNNYPFAMEVVSDPYDVFAPGSIKHPLRYFFRKKFSSSLKNNCLKACAVSYVTKNTLQKIYPTTKDVFNSFYSSIQMDDDAYALNHRFFTKKKTYNLIFVGSLSQQYKAPDVLIDSIHICTKLGIDINVNFVGDGKFRKALEQRAATKGLKERINFLGHIPSGENVRYQLDKADLFVLPSRGEGLPRAMIEAMARGLPCIGTSASGIPELLSEDEMVPPDDACALAKKIIDVLTDPNRMTQMSCRNLEKSKEYRTDILQARRIKFYEHVKFKTENFLKKNSG